ncbi:YlmH/Sll1252 family protein [Hominifimenecus sp. rT4P-3]|uniref:YlmH/Sll1252 family protein n=1 Tax=Hominifimenecus sp. rT4P-3 TaxID=3242979 RepID=UPI003DA67619
MDDEQVLRKRFLDLAGKAYRQNNYCYTGFLSLAEQSVLRGMNRELPSSGWRLFGGREGCDRQMAEFGAEEAFGYSGEFPIALLRVFPRQEKFADTLTHRDFLGAILNLGLERDVIGDIIIKEKTAYIFCTESMASFLCENLERVKHTAVICERTEEMPKEAAVKKEERFLLAASERADVVIAALYGKSRSQVLELFRRKQVYINGREMENPSYVLKIGDEVTVRGFGKAIYQGVEGETRKGRSRIRMEVYI